MNTNKLVFTKREFFYLVIAVLLFFQIYLQEIFRFMQYWDELVTLFCIYQILMFLLGGRVNKSYAKIILAIVMIATIGLLGNATAKIQTNLAPILTDLGNTFKVFVVFIGATIYQKKIQSKERIIVPLATIIRCFVLVLFAFMLLHELGIVNMGTDMRYGLNSFQFINNGAGQLSIMFYSILLILTADLNYGLKSKHGMKQFFIILALIVWLSTLRSRAFMYVLTYVFLYWKLVAKNKKLEFNLQNVIVVFVILLMFGADQFETYFMDESAARSNLMRYGLYTMQRYFPLGSGFATYGTDAAVTYYSKLYVEYGFEYVYGLSRDVSMFASDTYWAAIFAQFGAFGTLLMVYLIFLVCKEIYKRTKMNRITFLAGLFICVTQISSSVATATFFNFVTVGIFFLVPLIFSSEKGDALNLRETEKEQNLSE